MKTNFGMEFAAQMESLRMADTDKTDLTHLTVQLLSSYLTNNIVAREDLAALIKTTRAALADDVSPQASPERKYVPAVSVRQSLASRDHILSLIDGKPYKMLKRHLAQHGLTPAQYRERYGLPRDYPMTAKSYSDARRETAARIGLGSRKPVDTLRAEAEAAALAGSEAPAPNAAMTPPASTPPLAASEKAAPASGQSGETKGPAKESKATGSRVEAPKSGTRSAKATKTPPDVKSVSRAKPMKSNPAKASRKLKRTQIAPPAPLAVSADIATSPLEAHLQAAPIPETMPASATKKKPTAKAPSAEEKRGGRKSVAGTTPPTEAKVEPAAIKAVSPSSSASSSSPPKVKKPRSTEGRAEVAVQAATETIATAESLPPKKARKTLKIRTDS